MAFEIILLVINRCHLINKIYFKHAYKLFVDL